MTLLRLRLQFRGGPQVKMFGFHGVAFNMSSIPLFFQLTGVQDSTCKTGRARNGDRNVWSAGSTDTPVKSTPGDCPEAQIDTEFFRRGFRA